MKDDMLHAFIFKLLTLDEADPSQTNGFPKTEDLHYAFMHFKNISSSLTSCLYLLEQCSVESLNHLEQLF